MRTTRVVLIALLLSVVPAGCGSSGEEGGGTSETASTEPAPSTYQVPDSACPVEWTGLEVTTDTEAEIEYLDDMPACTNAEADTTYLENGSDGVWLLRSTSANSGLTTPIEVTLAEQSFVAAVSSRHPGEIIFVPGAKVSVDLPPEEVEWTLDLALSFAWQGHDIVVDKIGEAGEAAAVAALKRQSQAGAALAVCTLAVADFADGVAGLEDEDSSEVLVNGLGAAASASGCRSESAAVGMVDESGRPVSLADDLGKLRTQTKVLEKAHVRLDWVQRAAKALVQGLNFVR